MHVFFPLFLMVFLLFYMHIFISVLVTSHESFITWLNETLLPLYYPTSSYSGGSISVRDKFFIADMTNVRLGLIRMRQLRVKKEKCYGPSVLDGHFCGRMYDSKSESKESYCKDCSLLWTPDAWHYVSAEEIWGVELVGKYTSYGGGGFINKLDNDKHKTVKILDESVKYRWIDRLTRAVLVEFTLYNANINMLAYSVFMVEFSELGGAFNWVDTQCFRPSQLTDATGFITLMCYILFLVIIVVLTVQWIRKLKKGKCNAFKEFWNVIDFIICLFGYIAIAVWVAKFIYTKQALQMYFNDKTKFVNFQHIVIWEYIFNCILGILCFSCTLRLLSALGYNKRLTEIATVLRVGGIEICKFFLVFLILFSAFCILGFLLFGPVVYEWRNFFVSFGSLTNTLIGRNSLDNMIRAAPNFAEIYFFIYVFVILFTMMTMFLAILNQAIEDARACLDYKEETVGISDVLKGTLSDILQMFGIHMGRQKRKTSPKTKVKSVIEDETCEVMRLVRETFDELNNKINQKESHCKEPRKFLQKTEKLSLNVTSKQDLFLAMNSPVDLELVEYGLDTAIFTSQSLSSTRNIYKI